MQLDKIFVFNLIVSFDSLVGYLVNELLALNRLVNFSCLLHLKLTTIKRLIYLLLPFLYFLPFFLLLEGFPPSAPS
mgnify:CR=1 FL=1